MGLSPPAMGDVVVPHTGYANRLIYQNAVIATNHPDRPSGADLFNTAIATSNTAARCNMPCPMVTCSATIIGGGTAGANVTLAPETYYMKKEGKAWIQKYLTWNQGEEKDTTVACKAGLPPK